MMQDLKIFIQMTTISAYRWCLFRANYFPFYKIPHRRIHYTEKMCYRRLNAQETHSVIQNSRSSLAADIIKKKNVQWKTLPWYA